MDKRVILGLFFLIAYSSCIPHFQTHRDLLWLPNARVQGGYVPAICTKGPELNVDLSKIRYFLYTKHNKETPEELFIEDVESVRKSNYSSAGTLKILTHGFTGTYLTDFPVLLRRAFLENDEENANVITVDWGPLAAAPWYDTAVTNSHVVAREVAKFLDFLIREEFLKLEDIHVIGYSLGGHLCGNVGMEFKTLTSNTLPRITSLDPAYALMGDGAEFGNDQFRVDPTDADFVDVLHTAVGTLAEQGLGYPHPCGHVDFYPNEGRKQPGCAGLPDIVGGCSHSRAHSFFEESITSRDKPFVSYLCKDWEEFTHGRCLQEIKANMGNFVSKDSVQGVYYLYTHAQPPFAYG